MEINIITKENYFLVKISGRIDASNSDEFQDKLQKSEEIAGKPIVFDFNELSYISSAGLRVLMLTYVQCSQESTKICILSPTEMVSEVLTVSGLNEMMPIFNNIEDAVKYVSE